MEQEVRFCTSADGTRIAFATYGDHPGTPLVRVSLWSATREVEWAAPEERAFTEGLADGRRFITFDRRGVGASERDVDDVSLEAQVADLTAIVDHLGLERFDLLGYVDGGAVSVAYAVQHPDRVARLALYATYPRGADGWSPEAAKSVLELIRTNWPLAVRVFADIILPIASPAMRRLERNSLREAVSPEVAEKFVEFQTGFDISSLLPQVQAPALVLHPPAARTVTEASRAVAALIPDARFIALEGESYQANCEEAVQLIRQFLDEGRQHATDEAALPEGMTAILFLDIADSTALTTKLGDAAYRERERALDASLRSAITEAGGTPVEGKVLGDGVMAVFTSARQAINAAVRCRDLGNEAGLPLHLGIHAGDVVREGNNVHGGAVQLASRVQSVAAPGEVLVSDIVRGLARTSAGVSFEDRGEHALKGIAEPQRLFAVREQE